MKRALTAVVSSVVLLLCWTALDDITTGTEPDHFLEWCMVGVGITWCGVLIIGRRCRRARP